MADYSLKILMVRTGTDVRDCLGSLTIAVGDDAAAVARTKTHLIDDEDGRLQVELWRGSEELIWESNPRGTTQADGNAPGGQLVSRSGWESPMEKQAALKARDP